MQIIERALLATLLAMAAASASADDGATKPTDAFAFEHVSCKGGPNEVRVLVTDVEKSVGLIVADLYRDDPEGFLKRSGRVEQVRFAAKSPRTVFCFNPPEPADYAIALYHDENANKTLDRGAFGIPAEHYGISNNPKVRFRAPRVDEAIFDVASGGANVEIKMNN